MKPEAYSNGPAIDDSDNHLIMNREKFDIRRGGKKEVKKRFKERKPRFFSLAGHLASLFLEGIKPSHVFLRSQCPLVMQERNTLLH
jgi:hypothetical protein